VNAKQFALAVIPIVLADVALELAHQFLAGDNDNSWPSWALVAISFIVFPAWAGARVGRRGGPWQWSCLGGVCVLLGTLLLVAFIEPFALEMPLILVLGTVLILVPIYALLGFLGGKVFGQGKAHGA
jgi:hypothetical protein